MGQYDAALSSGGPFALIGGFWNDGTLAVITPAGNNVTTSFGNLTITFAGVSMPGTTAITAIDPTSQGAPPLGYSVGGLAYDIKTTASYTAPVTLCFNFPLITDRTAFLNLRILHGEGGVLVDRTSSLDFSSKTVCAGVTSLSPFIVATLIAPRDDKQGVLDQLIALRAKVSDKHDTDTLDEAIKQLTNSLDPVLWIDAFHLQSKGGEKDFDEEMETVEKLSELMKDKKSSISDPALQVFIDRIVSADRGLAQVAIDDAIAAHGDGKEIEQAKDEIAEGDSEAASGKDDGGIDHYREAWKHALKAAGKA